MPGSATFDSYAIPLDGVAVRIAVYRYDSTEPAGERIGSAVPNVRCVAVQWFDGPHPQAARFEYVFDDADLDSPYPTQFESVWPLDASSDYIVNNDDELIVFAYDANGNRTPVFHGFAQIPQVDLTAGGQAATFAAVGVAVRLWDNPIAGSTWRQSDQINSHLASDTVATDLPTHFNPLISLYGNPVMKKNCTPDSHDVGEGTDTAYPVFLDPYLLPPLDSYTFWTLGKLARYLMQTYNKDQKYVKNPVKDDVESILICYAPEGQFFDPNDSATFTANPIEVRDFDATNMAWPDALYQAISPHGISLSFVLESDANGEPRNSLQLYRKDSKTLWQPKSLSLQQSGDLLDPGLTNVGEFHASRDNHSIGNRFVIESEPVLYEVSIVLAPGFQPASGDESNATRPTFTRTELAKDTSAVNQEKYRRFVANEDGSGFWDFAATPPALASTPILDLSSIFGKSEPQADGQPGPPVYIKRCRPCHDTLISRDNKGRPYKSQLAVSRDYTGKSPAIWDATGTWRAISGGWELLKDRIGIRVNAEDPEMWNIGRIKNDTIEPSGTLRGIRSMCNPDAQAKRFYLRLTTVIESDQVLRAIADVRESSPTQFTITRRIASGDHFRKEVIAPGTAYNLTDVFASDVDAAGNKLRDDSKVALAFAQALRSAHEMPPLGGTVTLPYVSLAYTIGDRLDLIRGRNVSLRTNVGAGQGEAPTYPWIEAISFSFGESAQQTVLQLADRRPEPVRL